MGTHRLRGGGVGSVSDTWSSWSSSPSSCPEHWGKELLQRKTRRSWRSPSDFEKGLLPQQIFAFHNLKDGGEDRKLVPGSKWDWKPSGLFLPHTPGNGESAAQRLLTRTCGTPSVSFPWSSSDAASQHSTNDGRKECSKLRGLRLLLRHRLQWGHAAGRLARVACGACKQDLH